jgi:flavin-dependent dehydrogenase
MATRLETDAVVIGAGTSGCYFAWKLAEQGYRCVVLEKERLETLGSHIGPFHMEEVAFARFGVPFPEGDELLHVVKNSTMWSPSRNSSFQFELKTLVMDKPRFIQRLQGYSRASGVEILEQAEVIGLMWERGFLRGVRASTPDGEVEVEARLVVDASGIDSAVRTLMPRTRWLETAPINDRDTFIVYMESWRDIEGEFYPDINSFPNFQGWYAPGPVDTTIVGVGMMGSAEAAKKRHDLFVEMLPFEGKVVSSTGGRVPYRRPPYSLVDNGFMVMGDAAYMNKPFSGEGVISAFAACVIAVEVADRALAVDDVSREALWPYNVRYFSDQGAKFAFLMSFMPALVAVSDEELEFFFSIPGVITEESSRALQLEYEVKGDTKEGLKAVSHIIKGLAGRRLRPSTLFSLARAGVLASALKNLYERFPDHPVDLGRWMIRVDRVWRRSERFKYEYFSSLTREQG